MHTIFRSKFRARQAVQCALSGAGGLPWRTKRSGSKDHEVLGREGTANQRKHPLWFGRNALLVLLYPTGCPSRRNLRHPSQRALNSAVECHLHTVEVAGSNPAAPTMESTTYGLILW